MNQAYDTATARCWAEVDLDALAANARAAQALIRQKGREDCSLIPVLKANAYGLGAVPIARYLFGLGYRLLAVTTAVEGLELRHALPDADVLVMGLVDGAMIEPALRAGLILNLCATRQARSISRVSTIIGLPARVHIKLNTGLNRLGFDTHDEALAAATLPGILAEGAFTHLALHSPEADRLQLARFGDAAQALRRAGLPITLLHALDSVGMALYPNDLQDGVRFGAWLYGVCPEGYGQVQQCCPVCSLKVRMWQIRELPEGALIGYDDDHPLPRPARIATLGCGYADGYPRLNNAGFAEVRGRRVPIVGLVCMDQMMVDVSEIPEASEGDVVTLLGGSIGIDEYASWLNLNRNDALCRISRRVPRVYIRDGRPASITYHVGVEEVAL